MRVSALNNGGTIIYRVFELVSFAVLPRFAKKKEREGGCERKQKNIFLLSYGEIIFHLI